MASHRVYYKGEGGGFPQVRAVMSLVCPYCRWLVLACRNPSFGLATKAKGVARLRTKRKPGS